MFVDEVRLTFTAGAGGNGAIAWRREAGVPKGGPFGGPGGRGGDVVLRATYDVHTLSDFRHKTHIDAQPGEKGGIKMMNGADAADLVVNVPVGTQVREAKSGKVLCDLDALDKRVTLCRGGRGGYGNAHFQSSTRQAPAFAELGDRGETRDVILELKLVADVALVGLPNAGKSTMISTLTNARPKIAAYPFTTLVPNLGILDWKGKGVVLEDVPGLIEGAAAGKGLGIQFLKHIERAGAILHLVDASRLDACADDYKTVRAELKKYSRALAGKPEIVALTKADLLEADIADMVLKEFKKKVKARPVLLLSAAGGMGLDALRDELVAHRHVAADGAVTDGGPVTYDLTDLDDPERWEVRRVAKYKYEVTGRRIQQIARMTDMSNREAVMRVWDVLYKIGALTKVALLAEAETGGAGKASDGRFTVFGRVPDGKVLIEDRVLTFEDVAFMFSGK